jgi:hypothetical protein
VRSGYGRLQDDRISELAGRLDGSLGGRDVVLLHQRDAVRLEQAPRLERIEPVATGRGRLRHHGLRLVASALELRR